MARIVVASYVVRFPVGGYQSWMLQWLLGFKNLGHDVYFVEKSGWPDSCFDPSTGLMGENCAYGISSLRNLLCRFGLGNQWCFVDHSGNYHGLSRSKIEEVFRSADLFVDHMRHCEWAEEAARSRIRVMVDGEPAFTQMQMEARMARGELLAPFDYYYSVGLNIGGAKSLAPKAGKTWRPIFDPVVLDLFSSAPPPPDSPFTTVMSWQAHEPIIYNGVEYGQKDVEFANFLDLPSKTRVPLELAIAGKNAPLRQLVEAGWRLRDSHRVTVSFDSWCEYIRASRGEFSVAKSVFVQTNSGFFSDRSAAYLASGRPVVMQETGFSEYLPCGEGLFAVKNAEEAAAAIDEVAGNFKRHSRGAREIAVEHLEASKVLGKFLREVGL